MTFLSRFAGDENGATAIEYVLIASFIALAIVTGATSIGGKLAPIYNNAANGIR